MDKKKDMEIQAEALAFEYIRRDEDGNVAEIVRALDGITFEIKKGTFLAVLGHNGCGKSTFARHLNALLTAGEGTLWVGGMDAADHKHTFEVRKEVGMVFQNPDNQIIGTVVEEDVAFGLENIGVETAQIWNRVGTSLRRLGMEKFRYDSPNKLSGGQKQKVAIAGILAMQPGCIVLDEATSMLDPAGRREVLEAVQELNQKEGITILLITHYMQEALYADQAVVMEQGKIVMAGTPREIFSEEEKLKKLQLEVPPVTEIANCLRNLGLPFSKGILTQQELVEEVHHVVRLPENERKNLVMQAKEQWKKKQGWEDDIVQRYKQDLPILVLENVSYSYEKDKKKKSFFQRKEKGGDATCLDARKYAVSQVSFSIYAGEFLALIGHTGSGKSTLLQMMNGLLKPEQGTIYYRGQDIANSSFSMPQLCHKIGLVFQYPEYQLFESTVVKDVMFGPKNQGLSLLEAQMRTFEALKLVGIGEDLFDVSPFELSGGQKRRVAIAGVLAMQPELMILDEPAAGLDPKSRRELFAMLKEIHRKTGMAVLIVSHSMEDAAEYAQRILVLKKGSLLLDGTPKEIFAQEKQLQDAGLDIPEAARLMRQLTESHTVYTNVQAVEAILSGIDSHH